jgi:hypothetical protein
MQAVPGPWSLNMYRYSQGSLLTPIERAKLKIDALASDAYLICSSVWNTICDRPAEKSLMAVF